MRNFKSLNLKEKAEYCAIIALYPLFLIFKYLGKSFKFFESRKRQIIASALCFAMILSAVPALSIKTFAAGSHTHCLCGSSHKEIGDHKNEASTDFVAWTKGDSLPYDAGCYYLTQNCRLSKPLFIQGGRTITICLNGYSIIEDFEQFYKDAAGSGYPYGAIYVQDGSKLVLTDCKNTGSIYSSVKGLSGILVDGYADIYNAIIKNNSVDGIYLDEGTVNFYGGTIKNNKAYGIFMRYGIHGTNALNIYGGTITGNGLYSYTSETGETLGGGVCNRSSKLNIYGGTISRNYGSYGGGVNSNGEFNFYGGNINNNTAKIGGGIYAEGDFNMLGGKIQNNTAIENGGGVYATKANLNIKGNVTVSNNNKNSVANNFYLYNSSRSTTQLNITGSLTGGNIGVTSSNVKLNSGIVASGSGYSITESDAAKIVSDVEGYETSLKYNNVIIKKILASLSADDFVFTPPADLIYNGGKKEATVKAKEGVSCGKITVKYYNSNGNKLSAAPTDAGDYTVKIDVAESDEYNSLSNFTESSWKFTIKPRTLTENDVTVSGLESNYIFNGNSQKPVYEVKYGDITLVPGKDYTAYYDENIKGTGTTSVIFKGNYTGKVIYTFEIDYGTADDSMYTVPAANENGWHNENITVRANSGYKIGTNDSDFSDSVLITEESQNGSLDIFIKSDENGNVYKGKISYKLDKTAPENIKISYNESGFKKLLNKLTFGLFFKETVAVKAQAEDALSGVDSIMYYAGDSEVTNFADVTGWTDRLSLVPNCKKIIYVKVTDKAGNEIIANDQGIVLYSESTVSAKNGEFDLNTEKQADVTVDLKLNGNTLREIKSESKTLLPDTDYTLNGEKVIIKKDFFAGYNDGDEVILTFVFNPMGVEDETVSEASAKIKITDTTDYHKTAVKTDYKAPLCLENGNEAYWTCPVCGKYFADDNGNIDTKKAYDSTDKFVLAALNHDFTKVVLDNDHLIKAATCTDKAVYCYGCSRCDEMDRTKTFESGNPLGHSFTEKIIDDNHLIKDATCTKSAVYCYDCSRCDEMDRTKTFESGNPLGHSFTEKIIDDNHLIKAATCTKSAVYCYDCSRCDEMDKTKTFESGEPLNHSFTEYKYNGDATYFENGTETAVCDREGCDEKFTRECKGSKLIDSGLPVAEISVDTNKWNKLLNDITFGLFFNKTQKVTIDYSDSESGVNKKFYYIANGKISDIDSIEWKEYTGAFNIDPNGKYVIYAKVTDMVGNVGVYSSNGLVMYTESSAIAEKNEFDLSNANQNGVYVNLTTNGNTLREVVNGNEKLVLNSDYTLNGAKVTINRSYLEKYKIGDEVTLTFVFNPMGVEGNTVSKADATIKITDYHKSAEKTEFKSETCTENGNNAYWHCNICGKYFADNNGIDTREAFDDTTAFVIEKFAHKNAQKINYSAATCLEKGNNAYWYCDNCGKYFADNNGLDASKAYSDNSKFILNALGHSFTRYKYNGDATYFENGTETADCDHTGCNIKNTRECMESKLIDTGLPTAEITLGVNKWNTLLNDLTFKLFFNETQRVTIEYGDKESGVNKKLYYISKEKIENFENVEWSEYTGAFNIDPNGNYIIYAKVTDMVGNYSIISSDGVVIDNIAPQLSVNDKDIYCGEVTIKVTDDNLDYLTVDDEKVEVVNGEIKLLGKEEPQVIAVYDKAGNKTEISVTVNKDHTFEDSKVTTPASVTEEGVKTYYCKYCDKTKTEPIKKLAPQITEGINCKFTTGAKEDLVFRSNALLSDFVSVSVDGNVISADNYTVYGDETTVKLKAAFLNTLKPGTHTMSINSASGSATTEFTIEEKPANNSKNISSPSTGDSVNILLWLSLAAISIITLSLTAVLRKNKKRSA